MRNQKRRADVDGKDFVPLFRGDCFNIRRFKNTSVIDQQVDLSEMFQDIFDRIFGAFRLAKIAFERPGPERRWLLFLLAFVRLRLAESER